MRLRVSLSATVLLAASLWADARPDPGFIEHMVYDERLGAMVFVENSRPAGRLRLWRMEGSGWALIDADGPSVREIYAAAFDPRRRRLVIHGGMVADGADTMLGEVWEFDERGWTKPDAGPGLRDHHTMVDDPGRGRLVLFGGRISRDGLGDDTWEYDGRAWQRLDVPGPGGRAHVPMAYDAVRQRVLLFGGMDLQSRPRDDLWSWNGRAWERIAGAGPPARTHHRMAFDQRRGTLVMFGGLRGRTALGDTWLWDGTRWREAPAVSGGPSTRSGHVMAWDPTRNAVVMFGGGYYDFDARVSHRFDDLWQWNGQRWEQLR